jgi:ubiquinone/menaquinone biosynthesis C-methylase UbiE
LVQSVPYDPLQPADAKSYFNARAGSYDRLANWSKSEALLAASVSMLEGFDASVVLDLGSGSGALLNSLKYPQKIAIDISRNTIALNPSDATHKLVADVHRLPLKSAAADLAICRQLIHYCNLPTLMTEIRRVLQAHGRLHIAQQVEYDDISSEWSRFWVNLRGIRGRSKLYRQVIIKATAAHFVLERESQAAFEVCHTWDEFFEKNNVDSSHRTTVAFQFINAPPDILTRYKFRFTDTHIRYVKTYGFYLFRVS